MELDGRGHNRGNGKEGSLGADNNELKEKWDSINEEFRSEYPVLKKEDLKYAEGDFDSMIDRISRKIGKTQREVRDEIQNW